MLRTPSQPIYDLIACEICLKEIPHDLAHVQEGVEYMQYFCGIDCYAMWQAEQNQPPTIAVDNKPNQV